MILFAFNSLNQDHYLLKKGFCSQKYPDCQGPRDATKSHHATDLMQEICWGRGDQMAASERAWQQW